MFPPPMTTHIWTPRSWISFTCLQVRSRASASMGSPVFSPRRSSPESLRMMRLYFTLGSTGRGSCMGTNETVGQKGRQLPSAKGLDYAVDGVIVGRARSSVHFFAWWCNGSTGDFDSPSPGSNPGRAASFRGRPGPGVIRPTPGTCAGGLFVRRVRAGLQQALRVPWAGAHDAQLCGPARVRISHENRVELVALERKRLALVP